MRGIHQLTPMVVVDEAHLLDGEMLEVVRFLLNFKMALILVGQKELSEQAPNVVKCGQLPTN